MTTARALAKTIVDEYNDSSMSLVLEVVRLVALEREQRAAKQKRKAVLELETPARIVAAVCTFYDVTEKELKGPAKLEYLVAPRVAAWTLIRRRLDRSYTEIGARFLRDQSTISKMVKTHATDERVITGVDAVSAVLDEEKASRAPVLEAAE